MDSSNDDVLAWNKFPPKSYTLFKCKGEVIFQSLKIFFSLDFGIASVSGGFTKDPIFTDLLLLLLLLTRWIMKQ